MTRIRIRLRILTPKTRLIVNIISTNFDQRKPLLTIDQVKSIVTLSRATIYRQMKKCEFPRQIHVTSHAVRWRAAEVYEWVESRQ